MLCDEAEAHRMAEVALAMIGASLAEPKDWSGDVRDFLGRTLQRWCRTLAEPFATVFGVRLTLSSSPAGGLDGEHPGRIYLSVHPEEGDHTSVEIGAAMDALAELHRSLPAMFWSRFSGALAQLGFGVWDHVWALDQEHGGWLGDAHLEWEENLEEGEENPYPLPSKDVPEYLQGAASGTDTEMERLLTQLDIGPGTWEGELLWGAVQLARAARGVKAGHSSLDPEERDLMCDTFQEWPLLLAWFRDGDALTHLWDRLGEDLYSMGESAWPAVIWALDPTAQEIGRVYAELERFCGVLARAARIMAVLRTPPGPLPLSITLSNLPFSDIEVARLEHQAATGQLIRVNV